MSAANLSILSFSIVFVCPAQPELASPKARLAFAKQRLARRSLTGYFVASCAAASLPGEACLVSPDGFPESFWS
ncbi:MAG: hypothetical protein JW697_06510 [Kosmotogaceae bacterium]|nr:hypothetical protein [Kosmotogaceae bacterium]